jgi:hypothetical protein
MFPSDGCNYCAGSALLLQRLIQYGRFPQSQGLLMVYDLALGSELSVKFRRVTVDVY